MNPFEVAKAITVLRPGAEFNVRGQHNGEPIIEWLDKVQIQPSVDEIKAIHDNPEPTLEEKVNALLTGGDALDSIKQRISARRVR